MRLKDSTKYVCSSGSRTRPIFSSKVEKDGTITLVETGSEDFYGYIQSFADSVDINVLMKRYMNGDLAALERAQGFYADVTMLPKDNAQLLQIMIDGKRTFEGMPLEYRQKFDNDFNKWFATMDTNEWFEKMSVSAPVHVKEEVKIEE